MKRVAGVLLVAASLAASGAPARSQEPTITMTALEQQLPLAYSLRAALRRVDETDQRIVEARAKAGLEYFFENGVGPRSDIVTRSSNFQSLRYLQREGLRLPLFGTRTAQQKAIETARIESEIARIEYVVAERAALATLRRDFVAYWQYDREGAIAGDYLAVVQRQLPAARSLRTSGFWTQGKFLDFLDTTAGAKTDVNTFRSSRRQALAQLEGVLGREIGAFHPLDPVFTPSCIPSRDDARAVAVAADGTIAKLDAGIEQTKFFLRDVRHSSIAAAAQLGAAQLADITPRGSGYDVTAGIALSFPVHAGAEEHAFRRALEARLDGYRLQRDQRRYELRALVEQAIDELANARAQLRQAAKDEEAKREDLREARVRFATIASTGGTGFTELEVKSAEAYVTQKTTALARSQVLLAEIQLLQVAPGVCSGVAAKHESSSSGRR